MTQHESPAGSPSGEEYAQTLRWWDGFTISLSIPAALFIGMGYAIGAVGGWTTLALLGAVAIIACLQNFIYSELAGMFPRIVGGIAAYANEAWRSRTTIVGPLAAFGYWFAWSSSLAIYGIQIGSLVQAQWFPEQTWTISTGLADIGFAHFVGLGVLVLGWILNILGMRVAMWLMYVTGAVILIPIIVFALAPFFSGQWDVANLEWGLADSGEAGWTTWIAWMFVLAWSVYGVESVASFTPEYKRPVSDTRRALRLAGVFVIAVYVLVPLGVGGLADRQDVISDPVAFYSGLFENLLPGSGPVVTICLIAGLMLLMMMTTADGGRVLQGSAEQGLTIKQLGELNRFGMPARAMTFDLVLNVILIVFVGEALAVITAGIMGYILCHVLALSGFVLLRIDRPHAPRPIRLGKAWVYVAALLAIVDLSVWAIGTANAEITGYGGPREILIAVFVLATSIVLYAIRRVGQDKQPWVWRNPRSAASLAEVEAPALALVTRGELAGNDPTDSAHSLTKENA
ncbi:APC family permease [Leucobacter sp. HY1910]